MDQTEKAVTRAITTFLRLWLIRYFPSSRSNTAFHGTQAAKVIGLTQGYLSEIGRQKPVKAPGIGVVIRLREQTGASFEEITGHRAPLQPPRPMSVLPYGFALAEAAADEALSLAREQEGASMVMGAVSKRTSSGETASQTLAKASSRSPELVRLVKEHPTRWSSAAIAAALALPRDARHDRDGWVALLDRLDDTIRKIVLE